MKSQLTGKDPDAGKHWGRRPRGNRGWDDWMASPTWWTWVWASSGRQWRTGRPGMLQSMGLQSQAWLSDWTTPTIRLLENSTGENQDDLGKGNGFSDIAPMVWSMKEIIDQPDFIKVKHRGSVRHNIKRRRQATAWGKIFAKHIWWGFPIHQGTSAGFLVWEDPTCWRTIKPGLQTTKPTCRNYSNLLTLKPMFCNKRRHRKEKPAHYN